MKPAARSRPAVPMPRPSISSDARKDSVCRASISGGGADDTRGRAWRELQDSATTTKLTHVVARKIKPLIGCDSMQAEAGEQTHLRVGVDVGGTFTDLVAFDDRNLRVIKLPSSPPA